MWVDLFDSVFYYRALYTSVCVKEPLDVSDLSHACVSPAQYLKYLGGLNETQKTERARLIGGQERRGEINTAREINRTVEEEEREMERCVPESLKESPKHKLHPPTSGKHRMRERQNEREMEAE